MDIEIRYLTSGSAVLMPIVAAAGTGTPTTGAMAHTGAAAPASGAPGVDTALLEVPGGYLEWSVLAMDRLPHAVLDDVGRAQDWLWAVYGEQVALAVAGRSGRAHAHPAQPALLDAARGLAYAVWAQRWWPASSIDAIPALDPGELARDVARLGAACDPLVDEPLETDVVAPQRASEYALAAGTQTAAAPAALVLARGVGGTDWRCYPPGLIDASEQAVSWELVRAAGSTSVFVRVAAAPGLAGEVPEHLRPWAFGRGAGVAPIQLGLVADEWIGIAPLDAPTGDDAPRATTAATTEIDPTATDFGFDIAVPGFGTRPAAADAAAAALRARIRAFVRTRLDGAPDLLGAEIAAAASDF